MPMINLDFNNKCPFCQQDFFNVMKKRNNLHMKIAVCSRCSLDKSYVSYNIDFDYYNNKLVAIGCNDFHINISQMMLYKFFNNSVLYSYHLSDFETIHDVLQVISIMELFE